MNEQPSNAHDGDEDDQRDVRVLSGEEKETGVKGKWSKDNKTRKIKQHRKTNPKFRIDLRDWYSQNVAV
eukprot:9251864-Ditylum_brightwellii.AAC.1